MSENLHDHWDRLATMLREELAAFGELFAVLESQRNYLLEQDLDSFIGVNEQLQGQADKIRVLRERRDEFRREMSSVLGIDDSGPEAIKSLVRRAPEKLFPMFGGLIKEIERLMVATRNYLKRNQMLVRRAYDTNRQFLSMIGAGGPQTQGYRRNGVLDRPGNQNIAVSYLARA